LEKTLRELDALESAIGRAEGEDFPSAAYEGVRCKLGEVMEFLQEEGDRLEAKILERGGLEAGRIRRSSE
jgi:hypothetical protein